MTKKGQSHRRAAHYKKMLDARMKKAEAAAEFARTAEVQRRREQQMLERMSLESHQAKLKRVRGQLITEAEVGGGLYVWIPTRSATASSAFPIFSQSCEGGFSLVLDSSPTT